MPARSSSTVGLWIINMTSTSVESQPAWHLCCAAKGSPAMSLSQPHALATPLSVSLSRHQRGRPRLLGDSSSSHGGIFRLTARGETDDLLPALRRLQSELGSSAQEVLSGGGFKGNLVWKNTNTSVLLKNSQITIPVRSNSIIIRHGSCFLIDSIIFFSIYSISSVTFSTYMLFHSYICLKQTWNKATTDIEIQRILKDDIGDYSYCESSHNEMAKALTK